MVSTMAVVFQLRRHGSNKRYRTEDAEGERYTGRGG